MTPLELFFDLVFVLAITQCTALMSHHPTWSGLAQGLLVLGVLWWAWVGYAWLTSVIDPEEGAVRLVIFAAMAALLIVSLCVPGGLRQPRPHLRPRLSASSASPTSPSSCSPAPTTTPCATRCSASPSAPRSRSACSPLASLFDGLAQGALWALAIFLDMAGPYFFGAEGWKLVPGHFAERHGLIVIIALGESIVAIGVGASGALDLGIGTAAVLGVALAAAMWWIYFDVVALISARRLGEAEVGPGAERAGPRLLLLHPPADGRRDRPRRLRAEDDDRPHRRRTSHDVPAFALLGGVADLPARPGRLPLPPRPHVNRQPARPGDRAADPGPGRDRGPGADLAWRSPTY